MNNNIFNLYDYPGRRKIHSKKMLKVGGLGIITSFLLSLCIYRFNNDQSIFLIDIGQESQLAIATIFLLIGGLIDDIIGINAPKKLFFQTIALVIIIYSGFIFQICTNDYINYIFTAIIIIIGINSMNLIDGIDGLSSGIFILFIFAILIFIKLNPGVPVLDSKYYILIVIFLGSIIMFFSLNFPPAKLFIGDTGSQLLGWIMALSIIHLSKVIDFNSSYDKLFVFSFFSVPFYDVIIIMIRRFLCYRGTFVNKLIAIVKPDQNHIHHLLLKNELSNVSALFIILSVYIISLILCLFSFSYKSYHFIVFAALFLSYITFRLYYERKLYLRNFF